MERKTNPTLSQTGKQSWASMDLQCALRDTQKRDLQTSNHPMRRVVYSPFSQLPLGQSCMEATPKSAMVSFCSRECAWSFYNRIGSHPSKLWLSSPHYPQVSSWGMQWQHCLQISCRFQNANCTSQISRIFQHLWHSLQKGWSARGLESHTAAQCQWRLSRHSGSEIAHMEPGGPNPLCLLSRDGRCLQQGSWN